MSSPVVVATHRLTRVGGYRLSRRGVGAALLGFRKRGQLLPLEMISIRGRGNTGRAASSRGAGSIPTLSLTFEAGLRTREKNFLKARGGGGGLR